MTNTVEVGEGEELFLEVQERPTKPPPKRTWQHALKEETNAGKKAAKQKTDDP